MYGAYIFKKNIGPFYLFIYIYKKEKNNKFFQGIDISIITSIFIQYRENIFKNKCIKILKNSNNFHIKRILITITKIKYGFIWNKNFLNFNV